MVCRLTSIVLLLTVGLAHGALAQSTSEEAYGKVVVARLDRGALEGAGQVRAIRVDVDPNGFVLGEHPLDGPAANPMDAVAAEGRGVIADLGDGLELRRLRFDSPDDAQRFVTQLEARVIGEPVMAQVRGDQVIVVTGDALADPALVQRLGEAAWSVLPAAREVDAALTDLGQGRRVFTTRLRHGPMFDKIAEIYRRAHRMTRQLFGIGLSGVRMEGPNALVIDNDTSYRAHVRVDESGASMWVSTGTDVESRMRAHFDAQGGHPPTKGLNGALGAMFGG